MSDEQELTLEAVLDQIKEVHVSFTKDLDVVASDAPRGRKASAARARKNSLELAKLYRTFRKLSVHI